MSGHVIANLLRQCHEPRHQSQRHPGHPVMKTFSQTLKLSFLAMLYGLIACNIAWWTGYSAYPVREPSACIQLLAFLAIGLWTHIVTFLVWLFVFLPLDVVLPDTSPWRRPAAAALLGFLVSFALVALFFVCVVEHRMRALGLLAAIRHAFDHGALPELLAPCAGGTVAAWTRALMDKPNRNSMP